MVHAWGGDFDMWTQKDKILTKAGKVVVITRKEQISHMTKKNKLGGKMFGNWEKLYVCNFSKQTQFSKTRNCQTTIDQNKRRLPYWGRDDCWVGNFDWNPRDYTWRLSKKVSRHWLTQSRWTRCWGWARSSKKKNHKNLNHFN